MTVQEGRGGHMRVCRPILELCIPPWVMRTSWDRNYRPHTRLRGRERLKFSFNVISHSVGDMVYHIDR